MATAADSTSSNASSVWGTSSYPPSPGAAHDADQYGATETGPSSTAASSVFLPDSGRARPRRKRDLRRFATQCATVDDPASDMHDQHNASSVPIYMTATFKGTAGAGKYDYTRSGNPTRSFLEHHIAKISNARHAFVVSSGMGALDVILRGLKKDDEIVAGNDLYGGSNRLLTYLKTSGGHPVHHVDTTQPDLLLPLLQQPNSKIRYVLLESPTNPLLQIVDIETISNMVHRHIPEAIVIVDNTMMSPFLQRPLELGADVVYDSATKYLSGHHDLMAGAIYCNREDVAQHMAFTINTIGNGLSPFDSFLLLRGIKTMAIRMERQVSTACLVATYLDNLGFKVNFPSLANHPGKAIHDRLAKGPGAVMSFETGDVALSEKIVGATRLWGISVSFGAVNSLISMPCLMSHASIDPKVRKERNLPEHLIRLCVGIEDPDDLLDDLESALLQAGAIRIVDDPENPGQQKLERVLPEEEAQAQADAQAGYTAQAQDGTVSSVHREIPDFMTSAPGKVILFGEHAVVHGVTAIAGALDLRCYCYVSSRSDDKISLVLPDIGIDRTWSISDLPFNKAGETYSADVEQDTMPNASRSPDPALLSLIASSTSLAGNLDDEEKVKNSKASLAVQAFLYLYMRLANSHKPVARTFTIRSALPIGAGLGSSAAVSVCLSSALLYLNGHLSLPGHSNKSSTLPPVPASHLVSHESAHLINSWAFVAETILHGNPSGVDNSVSTLGSALLFQRSKFPGEKPSMRSLHHFKSIRFLLTDTKIPRDTKTLVANVNQKRQEDPDYINGILQEIQHVSDQAIIALDSDNLSRHEQIQKLETLVDRNHELLRLLEVSHSSLEAIKIKAQQKPYGLHTKLTGAGGGGCAVTVVPDDFPEEKLEQLRAELHADGFACYETAVGGSGVGVLPLPTTSSLGESASTHVSVEGGAEEDVLPFLAQFKNVQGASLAELAESLGKWAFA